MNVATGLCPSSNLKKIDTFESLELFERQAFVKSRPLHQADCNNCADDKSLPFKQFRL